MASCGPPAVPATQCGPECRPSLGATGELKALPTESPGFLTVLEARMRNSSWAITFREAG